MHMWSLWEETRMFKKAYALMFDGKEIDCLGESMHLCFTGRKEIV